MKKIGLIYGVPFIIAVFCLVLFYKKINSIFFYKESKVIIDSSFRYLENFRNNQLYEEQFLSGETNSETIYLLGSSELSGNTSALPYNFITDHFKTKLKAVGFEGNQCFSIYAQLLANEKRLKNAPVIIVLSPGWFESKASQGISSSSFLKYNSERFFHKAITNENNTEFHAYLFKRVAQLYSEFNSPGLELKLMNFKYCASKSYFHRAVFSPLIFFDNLLLALKKKITPQLKSDGLSFKRFPIIHEHVSINWDSLHAVSKEEGKKRATNNNMGIDDNYYSEHIHGRIGRIQPVDKMFNRELEDFFMLVKLLKDKMVNASFIISPLNALYYKNIKDILPTINLIEKEIKANGFSYLNLLETDTARYDKAMLRDVMHLSDFGWYKADQFIIETYHLNQ